MRTLVASVMLMPLLAGAQVMRPTATLDTTVLRIGEQTRLTLLVEYPPDELQRDIGWPEVPPQLTPQVEVVHDSGVDTVLLGMNDALHTVQQVRVLTITAFDTGFWAIPPFSFRVGGRAMETQPLLLEVRGVELDTAVAMHGLKPLYRPPFSLGFWLREHWTWLAGGAALAALVLLLLWRLRNGPAPAATPVSLEEQLPLHERVRRDLLALEQERLWQQGQHKAYQSRLTDLLRGYIEERYTIPALERTTDELLQELNVSPLSGEQRTQLANMLRLADMVKFAKAVPTPAENEGMMAAALRFVHDTADRRTAVSPTPSSATDA